MSEDLINSVPPQLKDITLDEWSSCMRTLQTIALDETPSISCNFFASFCCGMIGTLMMSSRIQERTESFRKAIKIFNKTIFQPRCMYICIQVLDASCCDTGTTALVIALTRESAASLCIEDGIH